MKQTDFGSTGDSGILKLYLEYSYVPCKISAPLFQPFSVDGELLVPTHNRCSRKYTRISYGLKIPSVRLILFLQKGMGKTRFITLIKYRLIYHGP
jgi:hypothetical protein